MRIDFYDARITDHDRTVLVKEKGINYECQKMDSPKDFPWADKACAYGSFG